MQLWISFFVVLLLGLAPFAVVQAQECQNKKDWSPDYQEILEILSEARRKEERPSLCNANFKGRNLSKQDLHFSDFNHAILDQTDLTESILRDATLIGAQLSNAKLLQADFTDAHLFRANLVSADIRQANFTNASLAGADLSRARLNDSTFVEADLINTNVTGAILAYADLTNAVYAPTSAPPDPAVLGIKGLATVVFPDGSEAGLVQLRELIRKSGLRDLEREATYSIERGKTSHAIEKWKNSPVLALEGFLRYIAFDLTTKYGLSPGRAIIIIFIIWLTLIPIYVVPIMRLGSERKGLTGIYRVWPEGAVVLSNGKLNIRSTASVERIHYQNIYAFGWSAYFSLLSAFSIGFRELTVGQWLTRIQANNYMLVPTGWVRRVSGFQSLTSMYLLAMWLFTYFGRPFE